MARPVKKGLDLKNNKLIINKGDKKWEKEK